MASVPESVSGEVTEARPSLLATVGGGLLLIVAAIIATKWVLGVVAAIIQLILLLVAFYLIARVGIFLLRKGR